MRSAVTSRSWIGRLALAVLLVGAIAAMRLAVKRDSGMDMTCIDHPGHPQGESGALLGVLQEYSSAHGGIGLQAAIVKSDATLLRAVAGYSDLRKLCPMTLEHELLIGSITKLFTAVLVMQQVERGVLELNQPIQQWLDVTGGTTITVRNLLNHTSGLQDYARSPGFQLRWFAMPSKVWAPAEMVNVISSQPLLVEPGTRHAYSNSNFVMLGIILENATGMSYSDLLNRYIAAPLDLSHTFYMPYPGDAAISNGYDETLLHLGRLNVTAFRRSMQSGAYAAGGVLSNAEDLAQFVHALFEGGLVSQESLSEMQSFGEAREADLPAQTGYGLGVRRLAFGGEEFLGHTGSIPGFSGIAAYGKECRCTISILANLSTIDQAGLFDEARKLMAEAKTSQAVTR